MKLKLLLLQQRRLYDIIMMAETALILNCAQENIKRFEPKTIPADVKHAVWT